MSAVLVRAFLFFAAADVATFALAILAVGVWRKSGEPHAAGLFEGAAWTAYLLLVTVVPPAFGFALTTSVWPFFRALHASSVAWISAAAGVAAYLAQATGVANLIYWIPIPLPGVIGAALRMLLPGVALGLLAVFAVSLLSRATRRAGRSSG